MQQQARIGSVCSMLVSSCSVVFSYILCHILSLPLFVFACFLLWSSCMTVGQLRRQVAVRPYAVLTVHGLLTLSRLRQSRLHTLLLVSLRDIVSLDERLWNDADR